MLTSNFSVGNRTLEIFNLNKMVKGWFVGDFAPTSLRTTAAEVAVKRYKAGDQETAHFHKQASEVTLVLEGSVEMCGRRLNSGDIIKLDPGEVTGFKALTDTTTIVVKLPSVIGDKFSTP